MVLTFMNKGVALASIYTLLLQCRNTCFGLYKTNTIQQNKKTSINSWRFFNFKKFVKYLFNQFNS